MKKPLLLLTLVALVTPATAQEYILVDDDVPIFSSDVLEITYETDEQFGQRLLPGILAADPKTQLFSQALQLTGLADTLRCYWYADYTTPSEPRYYYRSYVWNEVAWFNEHRYKNFTVFAETDDVFAAQGIGNIEQLKAYAKQVYDPVFPDDAAISDPTDRRNSLNRFVAYHILRHGSTYWYLTFYDGKMTERFVDATLTDINVWYGTLMEQGVLKFSYPLIGNDSGVYLNHRGLGTEPDKYGKQVRGAKVVADGEQGFDHPCFNGNYFYIDRILAYDLPTRDDVLGSELWRMDFKTLSPDIMNNYQEMRGDYFMTDDPGSTHSGHNYIYKWDAMENITGHSPEAPGLVARRTDANFYCWQGDEINIFGPFDINIQLPTLPPGEWEVRMGLAVTDMRPSVNVYLNGQLTIDSLVLSRGYYDADMPFGQTPLGADILAYMETHVFTVEQQGDSLFLVTDVKTGEQMLTTEDPYKKMYNGPYLFYTGVLHDAIIAGFIGIDSTTGESIDWSERANNYRAQAIKDYTATQPKVMHAPKACMRFNSGGHQFSLFDDSQYSLRYVLGHIVSDGRNRNTLRIEWRAASPYSSAKEMMIDYFELVPKAVYDNQEIPEE